MSGTTLEDTFTRRHKYPVVYATDISTTGGEEPPMVAPSGSEPFVEPESRLAGFTLRGSTSAWQRDVWCFLTHARNLLVHFPDVEIPDEQPGYLDDFTTNDLTWHEFAEAVGRTAIPKETIHPARTELGRRLREIRLRIKASGQPLLDWDAIDREMHQRRGEYEPEETL